jgi:hypothetical protein
MSFRPEDILYLVADFGKTLTLSRTTGATYNPATGSTGGGTQESFTFTGYLYNNATRSFEDTSITRGNRMCVLPYPDAVFPPAEGDTISGDGDSLNIEAINMVMSGDNPVCYMLELSE